MRRRRTLLGAGIAAALAAGALGIGPAGAASPSITAKGGFSYEPNRYVRSDQRFTPDVKHVRSGDLLTLRNEDRGGEPHTWTLAEFGRDLPLATEDLFGGCQVCDEAAEAHFPEEGPPVFAVDTGEEGFDQRGDSYLLFGGESVQVPVSAPRGTNLFYICAFHPWMQARINVR